MLKGTNKINGDVSCLNIASDTMNTVFSFEHLYRSFEKATCGVKWKLSTQNFMVNACCRLVRIRKQILSGTYKNQPMRHFTIYERGKTRNISALSFQDRVVHKCLCDYYLTPLLSKSIIYDSGATLKNKGLGFTRKRIITHLQKYYRKNKNKGYVLKIDLHNYFESIDHEILMNKINKKVKDEQMLKLIRQCIDLNEKGLGLGSQVSQISAMFYLNDLDHYIKEKLHCKFYGRYMDDLYIIEKSKWKLRHCLKEIRNIVHKEKLTLSENKTHIYKLRNGFVFCKCRYFLTKTGKIKRFPVGHSIKIFHRKYKKGIRLLDIVPAFKSYLANFNCYKLIKSCIINTKGESLCQKN